jgi:two-component sensor histidine kinase
MPHRAGPVRQRLVRLLLLASSPVLLLALFGSHMVWRAGMERAEQALARELEHMVALERVLRDDRTALRPPPGFHAWLVDAAGARQPLGDPPPQEEMMAAEAALRPGVSLVVARPAAPVRRAALRTALLHFAEIIALLALSGAAVQIGMTGAITRPLRRLRDAVRDWRAGGRLRIPDEAAMPEELRDLAVSFRAGADALASREAELRAAVAHAELLTGEVHHRVKNNLQTVSSLLALQAHRISDPIARAEFEAARDRVGALATLHRHLYVEHDPEALDLGAFIAELGAQLFAAVGERPGRRIALEAEAPSLRISSDQAVPLALVITEAVADALRQGFPEGRQGRIAIAVTVAGDRAGLAIEDDGALPRAPDPLRAMLLRGLGRQLGGELRIEGGRVALDFRLRPAASRPPVSLRPPTPPPEPSAPA